MEPILRNPTKRNYSAPRRPHGEKWTKVAEFLRSHPGEWAFVGTYSSGIAPAIRRGDYPAFCPEGMEIEERKSYMEENFEVTTNNVEGANPRRCDVFIRWVGDRG